MTTQQQTQPQVQLNDEEKECREVVKNSIHRGRPTVRSFEMAERVAKVLNEGSSWTYFVTPSDQPDQPGFCVECVDEHNNFVGFM